MTRPAALAACAVLLGCASTPPAAPPSRAPVVIDNPRFIRTPTAAEVARVYPFVPPERAMSVTVVLLCSPGRDGSLSLCSADSAASADYAFRIAAMRLSSNYRLEPGSTPAYLAVPTLVRVAVELTPPAVRPPVLRGADEVPAAELVYLVRPDGEMLNRFYPDRARERGVEGYGEVLCRVGQSGQLSECGIVEEAPLNSGFGVASLRMMQVLRVGPQTRSGEPSAGKRVRHRIFWLLPD